MQARAWPSVSSRSAARVWPLTTFSVTPLSRSSSVSPTQTMGVSPAASAALIFRLTVSSVSAKYWRRSLWPMTTYCAPTSVSMDAEISPVYAPFSAKCRFCAPTFILVPFVSSTAVCRSTKGTSATTSQSAPATSGLSCASSSAAAFGPLFIFQFPAMTARRFALFINSLPLFSLCRPGRRWRAVLCPRETRATRRRRWRYASSYRRSRAAPRPPRCRRRR